MNTSTLVPLLFLVGMLGAGCASVDGDRVATQEPQPVTPPPADASVKRLPFPAAERKSPSETNVVSYATYRDPLIHVNRVIFAFNDVTYRYLLIPISQGYTWVVPDPVETCVGNVFDNIKRPIVLVNHLLQWEPKRAGDDALSFCINTTIGLLGLFDPATAWFGIEEEQTHIDDTLASYSVGYGVYLVLPLIGPSDLRNGASLVTEAFMSPIPYLIERPTSTAIQAYDTFQDFAPSAEDYKTLRRKSDDPYIFFRNLYLQGIQRDADY